MDKLKIEFDVPLPDRNAGGTSTQILRALCDAPLGASVLFTSRSYDSLRAQVSKVGKERGVKLVTRKTVEGIRVWHTL